MTDDRKKDKGGKYHREGERGWTVRGSERGIYVT